MCIREKGSRRNRGEEKDRSKFISTIYQKIVDQVRERDRENERESENKQKVYSTRLVGAAVSRPSH